MKSDNRELTVKQKMIDEQREIMNTSLTDHELLRRKRARVKLKRRLLSMPWYQLKAESSGNRYWRHLHTSRVLSD